MMLGTSASVLIEIRVESDLDRNLGISSHAFVALPYFGITEFSRKLNFFKFSKGLVRVRGIT